jgi:hypothetical protein
MNLMLLVLDRILLDPEINLSAQIPCKISTCHVRKIFSNDQSHSIPVLQYYDILFTFLSVNIANFNSMSIKLQINKNNRLNNCVSKVVCIDLIIQVFIAHKHANL